MAQPIQVGFLTHGCPSLDVLIDGDKNAIRVASADQVNYMKNVGVDATNGIK